MKILVIGATGGTGRQIVQEALAQGYEVNALVRSVAKAVDFHRELTREGYKFPLRIGFFRTFRDGYLVLRFRNWEIQKVVHFHGYSPVSRLRSLDLPR
ncbi:NAD(P)H-binding protein, partial [Acetobacter tropicalis]|uniref:NAD(P)H-binding protein n=1 Tax=Acetobacter tropicalis TaxID=104102 RepID=UPI003976ACAF